MLAHFPHYRSQPDPKALKGARVIREADQILEDYRKQDAALRLIVVRKRH